MSLCDFVDKVFKNYKAPIGIIFNDTFFLIRHGMSKQSVIDGWFLQRKLDIKRWRVEESIYNEEPWQTFERSTGCRWELGASVRAFLLRIFAINSIPGSAQANLDLQAIFFSLERGERIAIGSGLKAQRIS